MHGASHSLHKIRTTPRTSICKTGAPLKLDVHLVTTFSVVDNGAGMSTETRQKALFPFFTTKPPGEGIGLGLSFSLGIVKQHGGTLSFANKLGIGSKFRMTLPKWESESSRPKRAS